MDRIEIKLLENHINKQVSPRNDQLTLISLKKTEINPPNPLFPRKFIPLASPKFGKNSQYIKLSPFLQSEIDREPIFPNEVKSTNNITIEKFTENNDIEIYANSSTFLENLVYLRTEKTKDNKLGFENIVNLKKKAETTKIKPKTILPYYCVKSSNDTTLVFESRFESGNLLAASKRNENEYNLILQNDTNTVGYIQWFFFRVSNSRKNSKVKFNIINLMKKYSLYNKGMRVLIYSEKKAEKEKIGWHRSCTEIDYYRNGLFKTYKEKKSFLSSLAFTYQFEYDQDIVFFANSIPYTYTELNRELNEFEKDDKKYHYITRKSLCTTLGGNNVDILTIASNERNVDISNRPGVVIMARVHPGETVGSWMMKGVIDFLTSNHDEAVILRENYVIKIIPMLNPDGVITGNYRTSFAGCDLNRRWDISSEILHPEIFAIKKMMLKFSKTREIALICDLHGHSGLHNVFMYGNRLLDDANTCRVFPYIMSRLNKNFYFGNCSFKMQKSKYGCARINLFNEIGITNIFTMEASFSGCNFGDNEFIHFNTSTLKEIGRDLCRCILTYHSSYEYFYNELITYTSEKKKISNINRNKSQDESGKGKLQLNETEEGAEYFGENEGKDSNGSDSEPSADNLDSEELFKLLPNQAKKKRKSKTKKKPTLIKILKKKEDEKIEKNDNKDKIIKTKYSTTKIKETYSTNLAKDSFTKEPIIEKKIDKPNIVNLRPVNYNKSFEKDKIIPTIDSKRKDQETQTEEIFFKMNWTYFMAKNYKVLSANIKIDPNSRIAISLDRDKKLYSFYQNLQNSAELKRTNMGNMQYAKKESYSTNRNVLYNPSNMNRMNSQKISNYGVPQNMIKSPLNTIIEKTVKKK